MDKTVVILLDGATRARKDAPPGPHPVLELVDDGPTPVEPAPSPPPPPAPRSVASQPPAQCSAVETHPPAVPHPEISRQGRAEHGHLPPPPKPQFRSPAAVPARGSTVAQGRAATLTDFPVQRGSAPPGHSDGWAEIDRSPLNATRPGMGSKPSA